MSKAKRHPYTRRLKWINLYLRDCASPRKRPSLDWKPAGLETFIPAVARGDWKP